MRKSKKAYVRAAKIVNEIAHFGGADGGPNPIVAAQVASAFGRFFNAGKAPNFDGKQFFKACGIADAILEQCRREMAAKKRAA